MNISAISNLNNQSAINGLDKLSDKEKRTDFNSLFQSMLNIVKETNDLSNAAEEEEIRYAAGEDNTLELMIAQNKANLSLSFTVAVRDKIISAYQEIMNLQF